MEGTQAADSSQGKLKSFNMSAKCLFKSYPKINQEEKVMLLKQKCNETINLRLAFTELNKRILFPQLNFLQWQWLKNQGHVSWLPSQYCMLNKILSIPQWTR